MGIREDRVLVDMLCEIDHGLSEWECDFVEGVARQVHDDKRALTLKQMRLVLKLKEKHLGDNDDD